MSDGSVKKSRWLPPLVRKGLVVSGVMVLLLVALSMVSGLIGERLRARADAVANVERSVGGAQTTGGLLLSVPVVTQRVVERRVKVQDDFQDERTVKERRVENVRSSLHVLPDTLNVQVKMTVQPKRSGLYQVPTYSALVTLSGEFAARDFAELRRVEANREVVFDEATLTVLGSEARTLRAVREFKIAGRALELQNGSYAGYTGPAVKVPSDLLQNASTIPFTVQLELVGSSALMVLPLARTAETQLESDWPHPKFLGGQSPMQETTTASGTTANWSTLGLSRSFGQSWYGHAVDNGSDAATAFGNAAIGVEQYLPVDVYQRNYRAVHYAVLVIALTLLAFFMWEHAGRMPLHGMHYLFVGLALAVFYVVLLALSEHLAFGLAYLLAAAALVGLVTAYLAGVVGRVSKAFAAGAGLGGLYATLYLILISEDYALLMGATLLFSVLAAVMLTTRRFDWSSVGKRPDAT